jgi:hypothetical protein
MSALQCAVLQNIASGRLAPLSDQPAVPSVLPPFSGKISIFNTIFAGREV